MSARAELQRQLEGERSALRNVLAGPLDLVVQRREETRLSDVEYRIQIIEDLACDHELPICVICSGAIAPWEAGSSTQGGSAHHTCWDAEAARRAA